MSVYTSSFLTTAIEPLAPEIGLSDLRKGLLKILLGYLLSVVVGLATLGLLWYVAEKTNNSFLSEKAMESVSTILFAGAAILGLFGLFSVSLLVRGKWICLMNAPEECNARWLMFASILCIVVGVALNTVAGVTGESEKGTIMRNRSLKSRPILTRAIDDYTQGFKSLDSSRYLELAGSFAGLLSSVLFVLFLRAVALFVDDRFRARFAELYLILVAFLFAAVVFFLFKPSVFLHRPQLMICLAGGWTIGAIWYFLLILSTITGIEGILAKPRSPLSAF